MKRRLVVFITALAALLAGAPTANAVTIWAVNTTNQLFSFDSAAPGTPLTGPTAITGLQTSEAILGIDFVNTGVLYALGSTSRLYTINTATAAATVVPGGPFTPALNGASFGFDNDPVSEFLRVVSDADQNLRLNPINTAVAVDGTIHYTGTNPPQPNLVAIAYTAAAALYGIDYLLDLGQGGGVVPSLVSVDGITGTLTVVGPLGVFAPVSLQVAFDIAGTAYAAIQPNLASSHNLYTVDLTTGAATLVGSIGQSVTAMSVGAGTTAVELRSFTARRSASGVLLRWRTASARDTLGFNVYRSAKGKRVKLNPVLIPAAAFRYSWLDRRAPRAGTTYWLQEVALNGVRTWHGPVSVR